MVHSATSSVFTRDQVQQHHAFAPHQITNWDLLELTSDSSGDEFTLVDSELSYQYKIHRDETVFSVPELSGGPSAVYRYHRYEGVNCVNYR